MEKTGFAKSEFDAQCLEKSASGLLLAACSQDLKMLV